MSGRAGPARGGAPRAVVSLARALSKLGVCSRTQAEVLVREGRVRVDGVTCRDPSWRVDPDRTRLAVDDADVARARAVHVVVNKPRGLVTTRDDPQGRETVYRCLEGADLPFVAPVGRLDRASEGLLLMTNDTQWAQRVLDPATHLDKVYHVQVDRVPDAALVARLEEGVEEGGETLTARRATLLRSGGRTAWLEVTLDEGRNRHIRRMLAALDVEVQRLVRVAIGPLVLGDLAKGAWRRLEAGEKRAIDAAMR